MGRIDTLKADSWEGTFAGWGNTLLIRKVNLSGVIHPEPTLLKPLLLLMCQN